MTLRVAIGHGSLAVAANLQPNQPTLTGGTIGETNWSLSSSAFSDPDTGDTHLNSDWQVTTAADTAFTSPVWERLASTTSKTSAAATGLTGSTSYIARVRYRDNHGTVSEYSSTVADTTAASGGVAPFFEDDFELATVGGRANTGKSGGVRNFYWSNPSTSGGEDEVWMVDTISHSGSKCLKFRYRAEDDPLNGISPDAGAEQRYGFSVIGEPAEYAVEYWVYYPDGTEGLGSAAYLVRMQPGEPMGHKCGMIIWGTTYSGNYHLGFGYKDVWMNPSDDGRTATHAQGKNSGGWLSVTEAGEEVPYLPAFDGDPTGPASRGAWNRIRFYCKAASQAVDPPRSTSDGIMRYWVNDTLIIETTTMDLWNGNWDGIGDPEWTRNHITNGYLLGYSNSGFAEETHVYVDDVKFYDVDPGW